LNLWNIGHFFFQNDVFKLQEDFSEHGIRVFIENGLGSLEDISYFADSHGNLHEIVTGGI
jgi:hypothetical protein